jgi:hypothetical protein
VKHLTQRQQTSIYRTVAAPNNPIATPRLEETQAQVEQQWDKSLQLNEHMQGYALQKYLV